MFVSVSRGAKYRAQCRRDDLICRDVLSIYGDCESPSGVENFDVAPGFLEIVFNIQHIRRDPCHISFDTHNQGLCQTEECSRCAQTCVQLNLDSLEACPNQRAGTLELNMKCE